MKFEKIWMVVLVVLFCTCGLFVVYHFNNAQYIEKTINKLVQENPEKYTVIIDGKAQAIQPGSIKIKTNRWSFTCYVEGSTQQVFTAEVKTNTGKYTVEGELCTNRPYPTYLGMNLKK